jgi:hypothetical protein
MLARGTVAHVHVKRRQRVNEPMADSVSGKLSRCGHHDAMPFQAAGAETLSEPMSAVTSPDMCHGRSQDSSRDVNRSLSAALYRMRHM